LFVTSYLIFTNEIRDPNSFVNFLGIYLANQTSTTRRLGCLVGVGEATHAGHHAEDVVVERIDADLRSAGTSDRVEGHSELEGRLVDTGEVAGARRLVLLGAESEGVDVDTSRGSAAVVLEGLDAVEVRALALSEAVLAVELELGDFNRVLAIAANTGVEDNLGEEVVDTRLELTNAANVHGIGAKHRRRLGNVLAENRSGRVADTGSGVEGGVGRSTGAGLGEEGGDDTVSGEVIGVVERLGTTNRGKPLGSRAVNEGIALDDPEELLHGVVKVELDLVGGGGDGLSASVLHLLNEVLVALLGKAAALLSVEVDVVDVERGSGEGLGGRGSNVTNVGLRILAVLPGLEVNIDANLVVLEGDERDRKTRVTAEPELERDVEGLGRGTGAGNAGDGGLRGRAGGIERNARAAFEENKVVGVADEGVEGRNGTSLSGELGPDLHPVAVLAVDALAADFNLNLLDEAVADVVEPAEALLGRRTTNNAGGTRRDVDLGEDNLNVGLVHEIGVTVDDSRDALVEVRLTVEGNLDGLHGEVRVALVEDLPESDLGVARDIDILRTVRNKLH